MITRLDAFLLCLGALDVFIRAVTTFDNLDYLPIWAKAGLVALGATITYLANQLRGLGRRTPAPVDPPIEPEAVKP